MRMEESLTPGAAGLATRWNKSLASAIVDEWRARFAPAPHLRRGGHTRGTCIHGCSLGAIVERRGEDLGTRLFPGTELKLRSSGFRRLLRRFRTLRSVPMARTVLASLALALGLFHACVSPPHASRRTSSRTTTMASPNRDALHAHGGRMKPPTPTTKRARTHTHTVTSLGFASRRAQAIDVAQCLAQYNA